MTYDLEAINTLFAEIAECMYRNPARAIRLLGKAKEKVNQVPERAASDMQAPAAFDIERAAKALAECMDYPWEHMPAQGREEMRKHARKVLNAAMRQQSQRRN